jgi:hypothetical protein
VLAISWRSLKSGASTIVTNGAPPERPSRHRLDDAHERRPFVAEHRFCCNGNSAFDSSVKAPTSRPSHLEPAFTTSVDTIRDDITITNRRNEWTARVGSARGARRVLGPTLLVRGSARLGPCPISPGESAATLVGATFSSARLPETGVRAPLRRDQSQYRCFPVGARASSRPFLDRVRDRALVMGSASSNPELDQVTRAASSFSRARSVDRRK